MSGTYERTEILQGSFKMMRGRKLAGFCSVFNFVLALLSVYFADDSYPHYLSILGYLLVRENASNAAMLQLAE